jgi:hypothetical protein
MQHQLSQQQNNPAFVLGNGTSRLAVNASQLLELGTVYGCNALYREIAPHYLIAVDLKMVNEILGAGYNKKNQVWTNPNRALNEVRDLNFFKPSKGWSSGPTALWLSAVNGHKEIYILGFDYMGVEGKFNNVYADTFNYKRSLEPATFFGNWLNQTEQVVKEFKNTQFYRVIAKKSFVPDSLKQTNLHHITYEELAAKIPVSIYSNQTNQKTTI